MTQADLHARLAQVLGPADLELLEGRRIEAATPSLRARPADGEQLAALLTILGETGAPALLRGGGSQLGLGHPVPSARVLLETTGLRAEPIVDPEDGVAYLPAGATLFELRERVLKDGEGRWEVPLDPCDAASTLGGALSTAAPGPRSGPPRDAVLGLDVTLATGERTRCGGRVVKNVTGYDLAKLYLGSLGGFAVIEAAWLRLRPAPERRELWELPLVDPSAGVDAGRRPSVAAAGWWCPDAAASLPGSAAGQRESCMRLELAGDEAAVEADAHSLRDQLGARRVADADAAIDPWMPLPAEPNDLRFRITSLASGLAGAVGCMREQGARVQVDLVHGLVHAHFARSGAEDPAATAAAFEAAERAARAGHGEWRLEAGPSEVRTEREVFGEGAVHAKLVRALKAQYDPRGVLNPGRQAGRV